MPGLVGEPENAGHPGVGISNLDPDRVHTIGEIQRGIARTGRIVVGIPIGDRIHDGWVRTRIPPTGHPVGIDGVPVIDTLGTIGVGLLRVTINGLRRG